MKLSELIIRRKIRRILQEAVPTSTAMQGTYGYAANARTGGIGAKGSVTQKVTLAVLGAIGARILYGIINGPDSPQKSSKKSMKAVICGDSQGSGPLGREIGKILTSKGYSVNNVAVAGAGPSQVLGQVKASAGNSILVVSIFGGNTSSASASADAVTDMYEVCEKSGTSFMAIGPPPVTKITNMATFAAAFPARAVAAAGSEEYWLDLPTKDMHSPEGRREISDAMEASKSGTEDIMVYGVASHWGPGGSYPDQPDGLHCIEGADDVARAAMNYLGIDAVTAQLKEEIGDKQGSGDIEEIGMAGDPDEATPNNFNLEKFKNALPEGNYNSVNSTTNALGKYQIVPSLYWDDIKSFASGKNITLSKYKDFLDNPGLQEDYMDHFVKDIVIGKQNARIAYDKSRSTDSNVSKLDYAQIIAATHFNGSGGPRDIDQYGINTAPRHKGKETSGNLTYAQYLARFNKTYYK